LAETNTGSKSKAGADATAAEKPKAPGRRRITRRKAVETHLRSYFDALAARDAHAAGRHWSEDGVETNPDQVLRGRTAIEGFLRELFAASPDATFSLQRIVAGEREAAVEWRLSGTFSGGAFQGIEPTGKLFELAGMDYFEVEDGGLKTNSVYYDTAEFARQVGMLPPRDSGAERAMTGAFNAVTKLRRAVTERRGG
jgi:steroid delta-isomerase-like uncharacterized protein